MKVLIVEDYADAAELLALMLGRRGCECRIAFDGDQALTVVKAWEPDLILMDLSLPDINGYEVAGRIRREGFTGKICILSGLAPDEAKQAEAGINGHLMKPCKTDDILALCSDHS